MTSIHTTTSTSKEMKSVKSQDAISLLKADHRKVEELFEEYDHARRSTRKSQLVETICQELTVHAELEESEFYPAAQSALSTSNQDLVQEAKVEHASLKWLIAQLMKESPDSELYDAKVTVLKEYVMHHVHEEEKKMFPKIKKTSLDLKELGDVLLKTKQKLKETLASH